MNKYEYKYRKYKEKYLNLYKKIYGGIELNDTTSNNIAYKNDKLRVLRIPNTDIFEINIPNDDASSNYGTFCVERHSLKTTEEQIINNIKRQIYHRNTNYTTNENIKLLYSHNISYTSKKLNVFKLDNDVFLVKIPGSSDIYYVNKIYFINRSESDILNDIRNARLSTTKTNPSYGVIVLK